MDSRRERVVLETDRHRIVGDLSLPADGYLSRLSDYLNQGDLAFVPLVDATVTRIEAGEPVQERAFIAVARGHIHVAYPLEESAPG